MRRIPEKPSPDKPGLHPRNLHRGGYDFPALVAASPRLSAFVQRNVAGHESIDFADPSAVLALNQALLKKHYGIAHWDLPPGYLCPPIPGRADYLHHLADLLGEENAAAAPRGGGIRILDIGVGANCIYPLLGARIYGWHFVGSEVDPVALKAAREIVAANASVRRHIELRRQPSPGAIFDGIVAPGESFAASLCNPPFHSSAAEANAGTQRKLRNLHGATASRPRLNFGGQPAELWCPGGETGFIRRLIAESAARPHLCRWFTTLVAKREHLPALRRALDAARPADVRTIELAQGQKRSRILAWRFA